MDNEENKNIQFYRREKGGIVCLVNQALVYSLDVNGEWVHNQYLYSMFVDGMEDYEPITENEISQIIEERKRENQEAMKR